MRNIYPYLTYAGAIPFIFCAGFLIFGIPHVPILGSIQDILSLYALIIASFMSGVHWGQHLHLEGVFKRVLPISSNIIAILLLLGFLVLNFNMLLIMFIIVFLFLLLVDYKLYKNNSITREYFKTRSFVSVVVILSLFISGIV